MTKWEYRIIRTTNEKPETTGRLVVDNEFELHETGPYIAFNKLDMAFSKLGEQGWELTTSSMPINNADIYPWFVFKRPLG